MAVIIPNVVNWSVTPQNGQEDYFTKMNVWLSESTNVIASLSTAITKINESNSESNDNLEEVLTARDQTVAARNEAVTAVATLTAGAIDDTTIALNKAFSNQFITNNYYKKTETYNKTEVDNKINVNGFTDKVTPADTDNFALQETGGLLKKLSFTNLKIWILSLFSPTITGTATLNGTTSNTIAMTGIVTALKLEVGDVIRIEYSGYNKLHTVETITNDNSIIVNYEHAGNRGNGSLKLPNATKDVTVTRIAKWYNAPLGLGQEWVNVKEIDGRNTTNTTKHTNTSGREMQVFISDNISTSHNIQFNINGLNIPMSLASNTSRNIGIIPIIPKNNTYGFDSVTGATSTGGWLELR